MPRGNWGIVAAALFGLIAFSVSIGYSLAPSTEPYGEHQEAEGGATTPGEEGRQAQQADTGRAGVPGFAERFISNPEPRDADEREKRDLAAQENTAAWAFWMVCIAAVQAVLSAFGIFFIVQTLRQGRMSIRAAFSGLKQAGRAARAAEASVRVTEETAKRELRAYVGLTSATVMNWKVGEVPIFSIYYTNAGQTPANRAVMRVFAEPTQGDCDTVKMTRWTHEPGNRSSMMEIFPGSPGHSNTPMKNPLSQNDFELIRDGVWTWVIGGYIAYFDIYGKRHITMFRFRIPPNMAEGDSIALHACARGNRSN